MKDEILMLERNRRVFELYVDRSKNLSFNDIGRMYDKTGEWARKTYNKMKKIYVLESKLPL